MVEVRTFTISFLGFFDKSCDTFPEVDIESTSRKQGFLKREVRRSLILSLKTLVQIRLARCQPDLLFAVFYRICQGIFF